METGQYIQDGTVKWIITDIRDGDMVGDISFHPTLLAGHIKANRASVTASDYPRLLAWVQDNNMLTTDTTDESKYLYDSENDLLTLPNVMDRVLQGGNTVESKEAGLPNIEGTSKQFQTSGGGAWSGAMSARGGSYVNSGGTYQTIENSIKFDASAHNAIYGNSDTVQSPAVTLIPQIKY